MDRWTTDRQTEAFTMDERTAGRKNNVTISHPYHTGKSCSKFG